MKKAIEITIVSLIMSVLGIVSTFPLVKNFTKSIPWSAFRGDHPWILLYRPGDHLQLYYFFWLVKQNLLGRVPFNGNPYEFNMLGGQTAGNDGFTTAPLAFISFLFSPFGDIAAYNCTIISSYILAGVFMYLLARIFTDSKSGALLAAVMFTFIPIRIIGLAGGNQYGFVLFLYPMIFYFMEKCIRTEKVLYSILAGLGIIALSFNEPHLIFYFFLCMAGYLPIRFVSLFPITNPSKLPYSPFRLRSVKSWPTWLSLFAIWGAGLSVVLYAHFTIPKREYVTLFSPQFWCMFGYYPLIPLFISMTVASLFRQLSDEISIQKGLGIEAGSMLPLYLFLPMTFLQQDQKPETATVILSAIGAVLVLKVWFLRKYLYKMATNIWNYTKAKKGHLKAFWPALFGMAVTVVLTMVKKTKAIAPSTESGGRTLHDVRLYSAHLEDVLRPTSTVYTGLLPIIFALFFLGYLLYRFVRKNGNWHKNDTELPIHLFSATVLLLALALSMGLALGDRSLYILFYQYVPFFNIPRVSDRFICVAILVLACITAGVVQAIIHRFRAKIWIICCSVFFLLLTALQLKTYSVNVPMALTDLYQIEDCYKYIKNNIDDGVLLELPLWPGDSHQSSIYEYFITRDQVKRINGYTPLVSRKYLQTVYEPLHSLDIGELNQDQYNLLRKLNVKYITVHEHVDIFPPKVSPHPPATTVRRLMNSPYLEYIGPWDIKNKRYDKIHEQVNVFRVREDVHPAARAAYYPTPAVYIVGNGLRQETGKIINDSTIGRQVYTAVPGQDQSGFLVYGPYSFFLPGKYRCYFRIKYDGKFTGKPGATIEVVRFSKSEKKPYVLATKDLVEATPSDTYHDYYLNFDLDREGLLEFRVYYYGTNEVSLERVVVTSRKTEEKPEFLEAEMMPGKTGTILTVEEASGHKVIEARPGRDQKGKMVYGPDMKYDAGHYRATFHLRKLKVPDSKDKSTAPAAEIFVTGHQGNTVFAQQTIHSSDLSDDAFKEIRLDFSLPEPEELSFEVLYTNKVPIQLDGIGITSSSESRD